MKISGLYMVHDIFYIKEHLVRTKNGFRSFVVKLDLYLWKTIFILTKFHIVCTWSVTFCTIDNLGLDKSFYIYFLYILQSDITSKYLQKRVNWFYLKLYGNEYLVTLNIYNVKILAKLIILKKSSNIFQNLL